MNEVETGAPTASFRKGIPRVLGAGNITVPWGPDKLLDLTFSACPPLAEASVNVASPNLSGALRDYASALEQALEAPMSAERLEHLVAPGMRVAIVVDDPSRWTPVREALPVVLRRLHATGVRYEDITISFGVGRHRAVKPATMGEHLGEEVSARYRCFSPPLDNRASYLDLGKTLEGMPVRVFRPVAEADLRILIGSVLPHLQAGFGGGYKLIFPGTSHRTTLGWLHGKGRREQSNADGLLGTDAATNPMRQAIQRAAERLGPCWSISHVMGGAGQVLEVSTGCPQRVQNLLAIEAKRRFLAPLAKPADLVVAGNHPWPGDPMQSFKALLHHRAACRSGGVLAGLFWTEPKEFDRSFPVAALDVVAATRRLGAWTIRRALPMAQRVAAHTRSTAAFMLYWARELVVDHTVLVYAPPLYERFGSQLGPVRLFADQGALWEAAVAALSTSCPRSGAVNIRIFPQGGLTYAVR
jgi:lactate racemase